MPTSVPIEKLDRQHPDYQLYAKSWESISLLNEAGIRLEQHSERFLIKRMKELFDVYQERIKRLSYTNLVGTCVGWYGAALFRRAPEIDIDSKDPFYAKFQENCDRTGTGYVDLWRQVFDQLLLFGRSWVMVDSPKPDGEPVSLLDELEMELDQPYCVVYDPRQIINWGTDEYGNLDWVVMKSVQTPNDFMNDKKPTLVWTYYDRTGYRRYEAEAAEEQGFETGVDRLPQQKEQIAYLVDQGPHALTKYNTCPFRLVTVPPSLWLTNRCYLQLIDYFNAENSLAFALFMSNLAQLVVQSDSDPQFQLAEAGYIKLAKDDKISFLEPEGRSYEASTSRLESLRQEIFRSFYLSAQGRSSSATSMMSSGYSKELEMMPALDILTSFGDRFRNEMKVVLRMVMLARGDEGPVQTVQVRGFRFETKPATESAALAEEVSAAFLSLNQQGIPTTLRKELMKTISRNALEDSGADVLKASDKEIDAMPEPEQMQQDATTQAFQSSIVKMQNRMGAKDEIASTDDGGGE